MMIDLLKDIHFGARLFIRKPVFTITAIIIMALSIGVNTAIFSVVNALLFKPLPVLNPEQLVNIQKEYMRYGGPHQFNLSYAEYRHYAAREGLFDGLLAYSIFNKALTSNGRSEVIQGSLVSGNYFDLLGVKAAQGRTFLPEEDAVPNRNPVVVINHSLLERYFKNDAAAVIGKVIKLNGHDFTIIGVTPAGFKGLHWATVVTTDVWVPLHMAERLGFNKDLLSPDNRQEWLNAVGRLNAGAIIDHAQAILSAAKAQFDQSETAQGSRSRAEYTVRVIPTGQVRFDLRTDKYLPPVITGLMVTAALVLLVASANLANLQLAHAGGRFREIAIRLAVGASRTRVVRQLLIESTCLSVTAGSVGLMLAAWIIKLIVAYKPSFPLLPIPARFSLDLSIDYRVLLFTFLLCVTVGIACGLTPAVQALRTNLTAGLTGNGSFGAFKKMKSGMRYWLLVPQVSGSMLLLMVAGLFVHSLYRAQSINFGFDPGQSAMVSFDVSLHGYGDDRGKEFYNTLLERARRLPGVTSASLADWPPFDDELERLGVFPEGRPPTDKTMYLPIVARVTTGFLNTLKVPLVRGRDLTEQDVGVSPIATLINETAANWLWPGRDAVGKKMVIKNFSDGKAGFSHGQVLEVVGVVKNAKTLFLEKQPYVYIPFSYSYSPKMRLIASASGNPARLFMPMEKLAHELDPSLTIVQNVTLAEHMRSFLFPLTAGAALSLGFGILGLLLAVIGIYGLITYATDQRLKVLGIMMAFGAQGNDILWVVMADGIKVILLSMFLGCLTALAVSRLLYGFLFDIRPTDPLTFVTVPLILGAVTLLSCYMSARRAAKISPAEVLRCE